MSMQTPKISIIIPVFNAESYLADCLNSVLTQTFTDFEVFCINDGSTDKSEDILKHYADMDSRFKVISKENRGVSVARNWGLDNADGEYVYFLDCDDRIHPQLLEHLYQAAQDNKADFSCCQFQKVGEKQALDLKKYETVNSQIINNPFTEFINHRIGYNIWSKLYLRSAIGDLRFYPQNFGEDLEFNFRFMKTARLGVYLEESLYFYTQRSNSLSQSAANIDKFRNYFGIIKKIYHQAHKLPEFKLCRRQIINRLVKSLLKDIRCSDNKISLKEYVGSYLHTLLKQGIISYDGLSLRYKLNLFSLIHNGVPRQFPVYYIVSGGFDPIHEGHIAMIKASAAAGDGVILLLNSDEWLCRKKGTNFMSFQTRKIICENLNGVIEVVKFDDSDNSASDGILRARMAYPEAELIFANGGDRTKNNIPELPACDACGVVLKFGVGGENKANASSKILKEYIEKVG